MPELRPGAVVVADPLLDEALRPIESPLADVFERAAKRAGLAVERGPLISVSHLLTTPAEKARLHQASGALAVDMESAALAHTLAKRGILSGAARVILDSAEEALPDFSTLAATWQSLRDPTAWLRGLRVGRRIPRCARISARLLEAWLAER